MRNSRRGEAVTLVLLGIVLLGGAAFFVKNKWFHGETKRAQQSAETTAELIAAYEHKESVVAADVTVIGEVAATLPGSREKDFIEAETRLVKGRLKAPDPVELLRSAERKNAVLQGEIELIEKHYRAATKESINLAKEITKVTLEKNELDTKLQTVAAAHQAEAKQKFYAFIAVGVFGALWLYTKMTRLSPGALATAVNDIRSNVDPVVALDGVATRLEQSFVKLMSKLKS